MIALAMFYVLCEFALFVVCVINSFKWFNVALTEKIKLYAFDRYYGLLLCVIFAYAASCVILDLSKDLNVVIMYFAG